VQEAHPGQTPKEKKEPLQRRILKRLSKGGEILLLHSKILPPVKEGSR
jgi:hypothetical protein